MREKNILPQMVYKKPLSVEVHHPKTGGIWKLSFLLPTNMWRKDGEEHIINKKSCYVFVV